ncbi:hypothetical protein [Wenyingzhuangia sp. 2_MG-2023]|uniref:hypothetical protein n=1 Tax=Wenyingzhuangia sp. 2_MG-2023 TaxID=3062639 RepID=UPI0026E35230|nr:hypothetical protein [Wenyingzhuangia sp. 2_MG-2023]MDO6737088.1 hypothetical protein [Wenyingzhuangia sp. 2_MG-2023]
MFLVANAVKVKVTKIQFITHGNPDIVKSAMLHKLIALKVDTVTAKFHEFLDRDDISKLSSLRLKYEFIQCLDCIKLIYMEEAYTFYVSRGISSEDAKVILDSYDAFRTVITEGFIESVESITTNNTYSTNYDKLSAIFDVYALSLYVIPRDAMLSFDDVNGRLIKYKDKIDNF